MDMSRDRATEILNVKRPKATGTRCSRSGQIYLANHMGDETICTFEPGVESSCRVTEAALDEFMSACIAKYGSAPPVWQRRIGETEHEPFDWKRDSVLLVDELMVHYPMIGG